MAFVLPAGDYERALRMAGASNFMEALESGIDRGMQRQAMREKAARDRELYARALEGQDAPLMSPVDLAPEDVTIEDLLAGVDTAAAAELAQEAQVAGAMEQALSGAGAMGAGGAMGVAPSTGAGTALQLHEQNSQRQPLPRRLLLLSQRGVARQLSSLRVK